MPVVPALRILPLVLPVLLLALPVGASATATGPQIISHLNAQRAAHGIPADVVEDASLSAGCAKHNQYSAANNTLTHTESPTRPGYTPEGAAVAEAAVIYRDAHWSATTNPFELAPIHLHQLLSPFLNHMGADERLGFGCATTLASTDRAPAATDTLFTYPGDGTTGWRWSEVAREQPFTPGQTIGLPAGTRTGPTLFVMATGPGMRWGSPTRVLDASLTGPAGPVALAAFDSMSPQVGPYLPAGAQLLPRAPLTPATRYTASIRLQVDADGGARELARTWAFTTATAGAATTPPAGATGLVRSGCTTRVRSAGLRAVAGVRTLRLRVTACRAGSRLRVTLTRRGRVALTRSVRLRTGTRTVSIVLPRSLPRGRYAVRAVTAGATLSFMRVIPASAPR